MTNMLADRNIKMIEGEMKTKESIVEQYTDLVHHCCQKEQRRAYAVGFTYGDIVSEGYLGLLRAFENFDESKNTKFFSFAYSYVSGSIRNSFRDRGGIGLNYSNQIKEIAHFIQRDELEKEPIEEISERLGFLEHNVAHALHYLKHRNPARLEQPIEGSDGMLTLQDSVGVVEDVTHFHVNEFMKKLDNRERIVVAFLIDERSQREIGEMIGVSQMQVSRIIRKIREKYLQFEGTG